MVPGGDNVFVQWSHGFVQMIDIVSRMAVWTYPGLHRTIETACTFNITMLTFEATAPQLFFFPVMIQKSFGLPKICENALYFAIIV